LQLDDIAEVLALDPVALLRGEAVLRSMPSVFLRHSPAQDFRERDGEVLDEALEQGRSVVSLRATLGEAPLGLQAEVFRQREASADSTEAPAQDGYRLAREVRRWLGDVSGPLGDMRALLEEKFGIAVVVRRLESSRVTAVAIRAGSAATVVLNAADLNRSLNPLITRVYLAHELCHALFDPSPGGLHIVIDSSVDRKNHSAEQRANAFAAELLLPREGLAQMFDTGAVFVGISAALGIVERARSRYGTPHEIAVNQLCNRGFIEKRLRERLIADGTTFVGAPPVTTLPSDGGASVHVAALTERAYREGQLTDGEVRAILRLDRLALLPWENVEL
jgi:Zn-dependent peptidase ImmA (M78 family)